MPWILKKILSALVLPPGGPLVLAALGLLLLRRWPRFGKTLAWSGLVLLWLLATPLVSHALMALVEDQPPLQPAAMKQAQAIVVLGGGSYFDAPEYGGDTAGSASLERIRYAARLARESGLPILVSGGAPLGGKAEGEVMREALERDFGVRVRWVEAQSFDTAQNAGLSAAVLHAAGVDSVLLVTHAFHMRRARAAFEQAGMRVVPAPTAYSTRGPFSLHYLLPGIRGLQLGHQALHEALGLLVQRMHQP